MDTFEFYACDANTVSEINAFVNLRNNLYVAGISC